MRENRQMTNTFFYCDDVLQMLFTESDSEGEYLRFGNDDRSSFHRGSVLLMIAPDCIFFCAQRDTGRQYRCCQCWVTLGLCAVPCNKWYHTLKNYKLLFRYLIRQIAGKLIQK